MNRILVRTTTALDGMWRRLSSERGSTATEYAIMLGLIFMVILASVTWFGQRVAGVMDSDHLNFPLSSS